MVPEPLPRPAPIPREESPTPIPRLSSLEELRASASPEALAELRAEVRAEIERVSKSDMSQDAAIAQVIGRLDLLERAQTSTAKAASSAADSGEALTKALTGVVPPKVLGAFLALGALTQLANAIYRLFFGVHQ